VPEGLGALFAAFRTLQSAEAWTTLGPWIEANRPEFSPAVAERFAAARAIPPADLPPALALRRAVQARLRGLLAGGAVLVFPTAPSVAPLVTSTPEQIQALRERTGGVTAIAGMAGLCEISLPAARVDGAPVGLSLAAAPGRDRALLALAGAVAEALDLGT
jgi:amidase